MKLLGVILTLLGISSALNDTSKNLHTAAGLPLVDLIKHFGYPVEVYEDILTEDGYLITMHRIPRGVTDVPRKGVVLLMHCLTCSAAIFAMYGPDKGLAYILADQGYDVWMPNARGTDFSRKHVSLNPDDNTGAFWRFSFHEIGYYDIPAAVNVIRENTGVEKMLYVGYSQGTTSFTAMAAARPEYNDVFSLSVFLAPGTYFAKMENDFLLFLAKYIDPLTQLADMVQWYEFLPNYHLLEPIAEFCNGIGQEFCTDFFLWLLGISPDTVEQSWLPVFATTYPGGCSANQIIHYGQLIASAKFRRFDYGLVGNLGEYGSTTPPEYDVSKITAPIAIFYGAKDEIATADVEQFAADLPNLALLNRIETYNHFDFVLSKNVVSDVYNDVIDIMSQYA
ncbi:lipase 3-like [Onthophagus taurus]|uniref:lipase 3-like n=1 Tax=Onthophagus taurus TaxID=166361 RepID=UPI000C2090BC|nr:lipase 3-like [Onthophagus taurus]